MAAWLVLAVVAVVRQISSGWYPVGDKAAIAVGGGDVLTAHHRLLGTGSSLSFESLPANHPGPLLFDVIALPIRLFGPGPGVSVGIAALNVGAGVVAIVAAGRQAGKAAALAITLGLCLLVWSAGNAVLVDPYNPTAAMVPFFAVLVLAWAAANRDRWSLPLLVGLGTFCVQANLAYLVTAVPIVGGGIAMYLWQRRGHRAWRDVVVWCLPVALVLWAQPILEQILNGRDGNMARLARNTASLEAPLGLAEGTRRAASVLSEWPAWTRGRFNIGYETTLFEEPPSVVLATLSLVALIVVLAVLSYVAMRWLADRATGTLLAAAALFVVVAWVATIRVPLSPFFGYLAAVVRWQWPIGVLTVMAVGLLVARAVQRTPFSPPPLVVAAVALLPAVILAVPAEDTGKAGEWDRAAPTAVALNRLAVAQLPDSGVVIDFQTSGYSMYAFALTAALQEHGTPFWVNDEISVRQYGDGRRADPDDGRPVVIAVSGFAALDAWDDHPVACAAQLDDGERARLTGARDALIGALETPGFSLTENGARFATTNLAPPWLGDVPTGLTADVVETIGGDELFALLDGDVLAPPADLRDAASDLSTLGRRINEKAGCILRLT
jgi:hypothetical protein